ncbi:hypothetical protein JL721_10974 [Aureococcus anophagefferens]|nr:hypothetical protein JL721_10974 [Aureococcus anophagefferens]
MGKKRKGAKKPAAEPAPESAASLSSGSDDERKDPGAPSGDRGAPPGEATTGRVTYDSGSSDGSFDSRRDDSEGSSASGSDGGSDVSELDGEGSEGYRVGGYHPVALGDVFNGRYTVVEKLGWGHFSTVWMVRDALSQALGTPRLVALKVQKSASHYTDAALDEIDLLRHARRVADDEAQAWAEGGTGPCGDGPRGDVEPRPAASRASLEERIDEIASTLQTSELSAEERKRLKKKLKKQKQKQRKKEPAVAVEAVVPTPAPHTAPPVEEAFGRVDCGGRVVASRGLGPTLSPNFEAGAARAAPPPCGAATTTTPRRRRRRRRAPEPRDLPGALAPGLRRPGLRPPRDARETGVARRRQVAVRARRVDAVRRRRRRRGTTAASRACAAAVAGDGDAAFADDAAVSAFQLRASGDADAAKLSALVGVDLAFVAAELPAGDDGVVATPKPLASRLALAAARAAATTRRARREDRGRRGRSDDFTFDDEDPRGLKSPGGWSPPASPLAAGAGAPPRRPAPPPPEARGASVAAAAAHAEIAVVDLGNACWRHKHFTEDIQTRQYRSPEVIVGADYDTSADMQELLGRYPKKLASSAKARAFFNRRGELNIHHLRFWDLEHVLVQKYHHDKAEAREIAHFLGPMLDFYPDRRATAFDCLQHPWLNRPNGLEDDDRDDDRDDDDDDATADPIEVDAAGRSSAERTCGRPRRGPAS